MLLKPFSPDEQFIIVHPDLPSRWKNGVAEALNFRRSARRAKLESEPEQATAESTTPSLTSAPSTPCLGDPMLVVLAAVTPMTGDRKQV